MFFKILHSIFLAFSIEALKLETNTWRYILLHSGGDHPYKNEVIINLNQLEIVVRNEQRNYSLIRICLIQASLQRTQMNVVAQMAQINGCEIVEKIAEDTCRPSVLVGNIKDRFGQQLGW